KDIMIVEDTLNYVLRAKSGWGEHGNQDVGWYVGYLEKDGNVYYFTNCVQIKSKKLDDIESAKNFDKSRREIVYKVFKDLNLIKKFNYQSSSIQSFLQLS